MGGVREEREEEMVGGLGGWTWRGRGGEREGRGEAGQVMWGKKEEGGIA